MMLLDTLQEKAPLWLSGDAPEATGVLTSQCSLARNLSDFPFPARCTSEEKRAILDRVVTVLDNLNLFASGQFYSFVDLDEQSIQFLAERRLVTYDLVKGTDYRGVYVSDDQTLSIMVNGSDHVCMRALLPGLQVQDAWAKLNLMDDTLSSVLDFAYNDRLGYLTSGLGTLGTGLQASVMLHLPCLAYSGKIGNQVAESKEKRMSLSGLITGTPMEGGTAPSVNTTGALYSDMSGGMRCSASETQGDLYLLSNQHTLGVSEEELIFYVTDTASKILKDESEAREKLLRESPRALADRVGRAQGTASGAHVLDFEEGLGLLSSLRLGLAAGLAPNLSIELLNSVLVRSQSAHIEMAEGGHGLELSMQRADLFREQFRN
jgi:protein arginine kinase